MIIARHFDNQRPDQIAVIVPRHIQHLLRRNPVGIGANILLLLVSDGFCVTIHRAIDHHPDTAIDGGLEVKRGHKAIDGNILSCRAFPEFLNWLRRFFYISMDVLFEEIFINQVHHFPGVIEAVGAFQTLLELLITFFEVSENVVIEPGTPASVCAGEEIPVLFFLYVFGVASCHKILNLLISQFHLPLLHDR
ncbi:Uncharacterised protein [Klebsiella oxytoca]|nr:Uncharacterised protein [Klebsiella oxytoca]